MADVFISYKHEDRAIAEQLANSLEQLGFVVWWDLDLIAGDKFRQVIREVIDQCSAAVVLWSAKSVESDFVIDEASHAKKVGKLCPALIADVDLPFGFGQTHADDLRNWDGELTHAGFQGLVRSLENRAGRKAKLGAVRHSPQTEALNAELQDFQAAQLAGSASALRTFLSRHPRGAFATFVRGQIETIESAQLPLPPTEPRTPERPFNPAPVVDRRASAATPPTPPPALGKRLRWPLAGVGAVLASIIVVYGLHRQAQEEERARAELAAHQVKLDEERKARELAEMRASELAAKVEQDRAARESAERERLAIQQAQEQERLARENAEQAAREAEKQKQAAAQAEQQRAAREKAEQAARDAERRRQAAVTRSEQKAVPREETAPAAKARDARQSPAVASPSKTYDLDSLHPDVSAAVARARDAERRANAAAARAREVAAKAKADGVIKPESGVGLASYSGDFAGNEYAGSFKNGRWHGLGVATYGQNRSNTADALRCEGEFVDGELSGFAVMHWRNGSRSAGAFRDNRRNGYGVFTHPDGGRFEGQFVDGSFAGYGVYWSSRGAVVGAGVWADNKLVTPLSSQGR